MDKYCLDQFVGGWFLGNFDPAIERSPHAEVCVKRYTKGDSEPRHFQIIATEITVVIEGRCRIGEHFLGPNEILRIPPGEIADFEALEDVTLVAVKTPSVPADKVVEE